MLITQSFKFRFFISLFLTMQLAACGTEEYLAAVAPNVGSNSTSETVESNIAVFSGIDTGSVIEDVDPDGDDLLETTGKLNVIDNDEGEDGFTSETVNGEFGILNIDTDGNWNYAADNNQSIIQDLNGDARITDNLKVHSIDGSEHTIVITIIGVTDSVAGANSPAVFSGADSGNVTEDVDPDGDNLLEVNGKLNVTDSDAGQDAFIVTTFFGTYGNLSISSAGNWAYAANNNQAAIQNLDSGDSLLDNITVISLDGTTHSIVITLFGADEVAATTSNITLNWTAPSQREDNSAIALSEIASYNISYGTTSGVYTSTVSITDSSAVSHTFTNFTSDTYYFVITTIDTDGRESQYSAAYNISI